MYITHTHTYTHTHDAGHLRQSLLVLQSLQPWWGRWISVRAESPCQVSLVAHGGLEVLWRKLVVKPMNPVWLVVWNIWIVFPYIGNVIIPTDFHIFQGGWNHQPAMFFMFNEISKFFMNGETNETKNLEMKTSGFPKWAVAAIHPCWLMISWYLTNL